MIQQWPLNRWKVDASDNAHRHLDLAHEYNLGILQIWLHNMLFSVH